MTKPENESSTLVNSKENSPFEADKGSLDYEKILLDHPVYQYFNDLYKEHSKTNNHSSLIEENIWPTLTGETLIGRGKINFRSNSFYLIDDKFLSEYKDIDQLEKNEKNYSYTFFHLGSKLSGHQKIIHGGLLATILDEITCRLAFQNFHSKKGVTANLNINYKQPCYVDTFVLIKCETTKKTGRKCFVKGSVFKLDLNDGNLQLPTTDYIESKANLLTECECLVIEPKWVHELQNKQT